MKSIVCLVTTRMAYLTIIWILFSSSVAIAQTAQEKVKVHRDKKYMFLLQYPSSCSVAPATHEHTRFRLICGDDSDQYDFFVNVQYIEALKNVSAKEAIASLTPQDYLNALRETIPDAKLLSSGKSYLSQLEAAYWVVTFTYKTFGVEAPLNSLQIKTFKNGYVYTLGFRSPSARFNDLLPVFQNIAAGFIIKH